MNSVLFIDIDTVLSAGIRHHDFGGDERVSLARHLGDRISDVAYSWNMTSFMLDGQDFREVNRGLGKSLDRIRWMVPKAHGLIVVALTRTKSTLDDVFEMFATITSYSYSSEFYIDELSSVDDDVATAVKNYLNSHEDLDIEDYAILSTEGLRFELREHCIQYWGDHGELSHTDELSTVRLLLEHAPWYEWDQRGAIADPDYGDPYGSDRYDKVILLDIDGVLNDEGPAQRDGVYVDSQMVDNLAHIVEQTGASIVLTSTWKHAYLQFARDGFETEREPLLMLQKELDRCNLRIDGMTPSTSLSGPLARPLEIMEWLRRYWRTNAYVILEDDTFWEWGWLRNNVVTTQTPIGVDNHGYPVARKGMNAEHALHAISILEGGQSQLGKGATS